MAEVFEKLLKYMGNDLEIWEMAKTFWKWLSYMVLALKGKSSQKTSGPKYVSCGFKNRFLWL